MSATPNAAPSPPTVPDVTRAPRVILMGGPAGGKTTSLRTLAVLGIDVFIIATEYPDILLDTKCTGPGAMHWRYIEPGKANWDTLHSNAVTINTMSNDAMQKMPGINKQAYKQWFDVLATCKNFKCERCGQEFGDASTWGTDRALVIDSLSGLSIMARDLTVGAKPIISQPDWGVMMQNLESFLNACTTGTKCWFVLTAHIERELDEAAGTTKLMASTLGRKLAPKLPRFFSDVIFCRREGVKWYWDTSAVDVDVKFRNLPMKSDNPPDFKLIHDTWKARQRT